MAQSATLRSMKAGGWQERERGVLLGGLLGLAGAAVGMLGWQLVSASPVHVMGITIDRLGALMTLLVAFVGAGTFQFAIRYLDGDPRQRRFLRLLTGAVGAAFVLMLASHLVLFFSAWFCTSLALHGLLTIYRDRPEARRPARKKFLISRLGDLALIGAIALIGSGWGTLDLGEFLGRVGDGPPGPAVHLVGLLVAIAALTKSAQFPFHSWLPETMESPTPVSALMHAGIINAGGVLLLRFAPVLVRLPEVLFLLSLVGTLTAVLGMLAMWAQVKVKRTLAWSTVSQMGFMMIQCGLGAFPAAALHIVGHGCYKAWSFLRSGELPAHAAYGKGSRRSLALAATGTALSLPALVLATWLTGFSPMHSPGELALSGIVALSIGQVWAAVFEVGTLRRTGAAVRTLAAVGMTVMIPLVSFTLYRVAAAYLTPVLGDLTAPASPLSWAAAVVPLVAFAGLTVLYALLPSLGVTPAGRALRTHALHGFYFGAAADRLVDALWSHPSHFTQGENHV